MQPFEHVGLPVTVTPGSFQGLNLSLTSRP